MNEELAIKHAAALASHLGEPGRMITASKGAYQNNHPSHVAVFNGNVCFPGGKVWWGDVDLTREEAMLVGLAAETGETVYLLHEWDARFAAEDAPLLEEAVYSVNPAGETSCDRAWCRRRRDGALVLCAPTRPPCGRRDAAGGDEGGHS